MEEEVVFGGHEPVGNDPEISVLLTIDAVDPKKCAAPETRYSPQP